MRARLAGATLLAALLCAGAVAAEPLTLRVGRGNAAEEPVWLMQALPAITPNQGKAYKIDMTEFRGVDTRFQAFQAGQLDIATGSTEYIIFAATQGLKFKIVASISQEALPGFVTQYMVMNDSPIRSAADLKGKIIGNNAARSSIEFWARGAVRAAGLNPDRDVRWAVVPFPSQGEALRSGKLDVGAFPQPFAANEWAKGGVRTVFTSKNAVPFGSDLMVLVATPEMAEKHPDVLRAYLSDLTASTKFFIDHTKQAKQALLDAKIVQIPPDVFLNMQDNLRDPGDHTDLDKLNKLQQLLLADGYITKTADLSQFLDLSYLPK